MSSSYSAGSPSAASSARGSSYSTLSKEQLQAWQQTQHRHEQIATGQKTTQSTPQSHRNETAATREEIKKFNKDADAVLKGYKK